MALGRPALNIDVDKTELEGEYKNRPLRMAAKKTSQTKCNVHDSVEQEVGRVVRD